MLKGRVFKTQLILLQLKKKKKTFSKDLLLVLRHPASLMALLPGRQSFYTLCVIPCAKGYMKKQYLLYMGLSGRDLNWKEKTVIFKKYSVLFS